MRLPYGRGFLEVELPPDADIIEPRHSPGLPDEQAAIAEALRRPRSGRPLSERVRDGDSVGIVVCDVTRPFPAARVLPVLIEQLQGHRVTVYVATGTHRSCTAAELESMLGRDVLERTTVVQHDCFDRPRHSSLGTVPGSDVPALVEKSFLEEDVRITTGFIEPHFFAGFSGGPKMVAPGLAALETVLELHSAARIGHPNARWGIVDGNPIHDAVRDIASRADVTFNLDVALNRDHQITGVFAGDLFDSHRLGCGFVRETAMVPADGLYDVVLTTNSGYPLDQNLYQTVKGMSAAAQIVKPGGAIVVVSRCSDGMPEHGSYKDLLAQSATPEDFLRTIEQPGFVQHDQWQVQIQAMIRLRARVFLKNEGVSDALLRQAWLEPVDDVSATIARLMKEVGPEARIGVLPDGPQTVPFVQAAVNDQVWTAGSPRARRFQ